MVLFCLASLAAPVGAENLFVTRKANGTFVITDDGVGRRYGRSWRDDASWLIAQRDRPSAYDGMIRTAASEFGIDPILVKCVILVESNFNARAVSSKGARGLMQLMPATARAYGVSNIFEPMDNIRGGTRYLNFLLNLFKGDLNLALAGYNAGENAVSRYGAVPPYEETREYVRKVLTAFNGTPLLTGGKFRTLRYSRVDVDRDPGRPVFAWFDSVRNRRIISSDRPPSGSARLVRLSRNG